MWYVLTCSRPSFRQRDVAIGDEMSATRVQFLFKLQDIKEKSVVSEFFKQIYL